MISAAIFTQRGELFCFPEAKSRLCRKKVRNCKAALPENLSLRVYNKIKKRSATMSLGTNLFNARKNRGLTQEDAAEKAGVSRQTIAKWETDETSPDLFQAKKLAVLYGLSLDELIGYDEEERQLARIIEKTDEKINDRIDWNSVWSKKYPVLAEYKCRVDVQKYGDELLGLLKSLMNDYGYGDRDACLVLKDILYVVWKRMSADNRRK